MTVSRRVMAAVLVAGVLGASGAASTVPQWLTAVDSKLAGECEPGTEEFSQEPPPALAALQVNLAWKYATGDGIIVAVVDSGIDVTNKHLAGVVIGGINLVGDGENSSGFTDIDGHGTAIAGEIAARRIDGSEVIGLAPRSLLLSVRVFRDTQEQTVDAGFGPNMDRVAQGIRWAVDHGATVVNVSLSDYTENAALLDAVTYAARNGTLVVASAGNTQTTDNTTDSTRYPAGYPGVVGVAATDTAGLIQESISGDHVSVSAPGMNILTSATGAGDCLYQTETASTSYATAYVSAAAALVAEAHPDETPAQWKYRLEATGVRVDRDNRTDEAGWGIIQPFDAITLVPSASTRGPESPFVDNAGSAITPPIAPVTAQSVTSPFTLTRELMMYVVVGAVSVLGVFAVLIVLRRVRRSSGRA